MNMQFDSTIIDAVKWVHNTLRGEVVFAGSFGLKLNGKLDRLVGDLDVFTFVNYYGTEFMDKVLCRLPTEEVPSGFFANMGERVWCVKGRAPSGIKVEFMYKSTPLEYDEVEFYGALIKVEKAQHAINAKIEYLKSNRVGTAEKHKADLKYMNVTFEERSEESDIAFWKI